MTIDLSSLNDKLPVDKTAEQKAQRQAMFSKYFDHNGTGYASLAECEKGVQDAVLGDDTNAETTMETIFPKPVLLRAFLAANGVAQQQQQEASGSSRPDRGVDYIEFPEFRIFLMQLKQHADLWHIFADMDDSHAHDSGDRRISREEFTSALSQLAALGLLVDETEFDRIDSNGAGHILFAEFAEWGMKQQALAGSVDTD